MSDGALITAEGVRVSFSPRRRGGSPARAVDGVDLDLRPGEIVALVGESGCGKTTLARALLGLVPLVGGAVTFEGAPLGGSRAALRTFRRRAQLVFQDPSGSLNPRQSVYEIVAEGLRIHGIRDDEPARVAHALASCGLRPPERYFLRYPHELSGGQRQRVVIAGAMVLEPRLLVADEPVSSLDASVRGEILDLLLGLARDREMAVLVVTHDLGLAWNIADRVAVMYLGRIVEIGPTEELLAAPIHPYTKALLSVVPEHQGMDEQILTGEAPDPTAIPTGCRFHPRCPVVQSGEAERLGVVTACLHHDPALKVTDGSGHVSGHVSGHGSGHESGHVAACHAAGLPGERSAGSVAGRPF
ncbi:MAG: ABC transporter ATP-binding protein [Acidimicrobiia bacterium]